MRKKILFVIFLVFMMLMIIPHTSAISISREQQNILLKSKRYVDLNYENTTIYTFATIGPRDSTISEITYQKGTFQNKSMFLLNLMFTIILRLTLLILPLTRPIGFFTFDKIDFTVEYKQDITQISMGAYITNITEIVNGNITDNTIEIMNEKHTVIVEGFSGVLVLFKRTVLLPPSFEIIGECDHYTLIQ